MVSFYQSLNAVFTDSDREECVPAIHRIIYLANAARKEGVLALEHEMSEEPDYFLKTGIDLIVDGTDPSLVKEILQYTILSGGYSGAELLKRILYAVGALDIQQGENPRIILIKLAALLGEKYIRELGNVPFNSESMKKYSGFISSIYGRKAFPECEEFEKYMLSLSRRDLQLVLQNISCSPEIGIAISVCGFELINYVFENLSFSMCLSLIDDWKDKPNVKYAQYCQKNIINEITKLNKAGEIIVLSEFIAAQQ